MCGHISVQNNSWFRYSFEPMLTVWEVTPRSVLSPPQKTVICFYSLLLFYLHLPKVVSQFSVMALIYRLCCFFSPLCATVKCNNEEFDPVRLLHQAAENVLYVS